MKNNEICFTGPKITSRDRKFERSRVNLLSYIGEKIGTEISLREIENFERSKFELSRVTCSFPYCGPSQSPGTMIWTIFKLHYIEKLSYTFELRRVSNDPEQFSHWKGTGHLFEQFRFPFTQGWFVPSLIEIGLMVLEKNSFFNISTCKYNLPYCDPSQPWFQQTWIYVI